MPENWNAIASEVAAAIGDVGFAVTLRKRTSGPATPWDATGVTITDSELAVVDDRYRVFDAAGNLLQRSIRTLIVAAGDAIPARADQVQVRGEWFEIAEVRPLAPGGVDLLYEVDLAAG
ncbi:MAG: hypothetical protein U5N55_01565 [Cypionkella sp.]|nr:hypothetical protein [Cypionkella sp.]